MLRRKPRLCIKLWGKTVIFSVTFKKPEKYPRSTKFVKNVTVFSPILIANFLLLKSTLLTRQRRKLNTSLNLIIGLKCELKVRAGNIWSCIVECNTNKCKTSIFRNFMTKDSVFQEFRKKRNESTTRKKSFVIPTKSFFKIGITKIFCYNNKMFSSINKTFSCCS